MSSMDDLQIGAGTPEMSDQPNQPQEPMSAETYFNQMYNGSIYTIFGICKFAEAYAAYRGAADQQTITSLEREREVTWAAHNRVCDAYNEEIAKNEAAEAQMKALRDALRKIGQMHCSCYGGDGPMCAVCTANVALNAPSAPVDAGWNSAMEDEGK